MHQKTIFMLIALLASGGMPQAQDTGLAPAAPVPDLAFRPVSGTLPGPVFGVQRLDLRALTGKDGKQHSYGFKWPVLTPLAALPIPLKGRRAMLRQLTKVEVAVSPFGAMTETPGSNAENLRLGFGLTGPLGLSVAGYALGQQFDPANGRLVAASYSPAVAKALETVSQGRIGRANREGGGLQVGWATQLDNVSFGVALGREESWTLLHRGWSKGLDATVVSASLVARF